MVAYTAPVTMETAFPNRRNRVGREVVEAAIVVIKGQFVAKVFRGRDRKRRLVSVLRGG
jgi:putative heme iron utilization protein